MIKSLLASIAVRGRNVKRWRIAAGAAWGVLLALVPLGNFFWIVLLLVSLFLRHRRILSLLVMGAGKFLLLPLIVMPLDALGWAVLHIGALEPFFTSFYNMPLVPFTGFNNTLVAGGLVCGIILWLPVFFLVFGLLSVYRNIIAPRLRGAKGAVRDVSPAAPAQDEGGQE